MRPEEDASLTGGGDCFSHWHSFDRTPTQDFLHGLQSVSKSVGVSGDFTLRGDEDHVLVDTSLADVEVTLPKIRLGAELEITKLSEPHTLTILPHGSELVMGATDVLVYAQWTSLRFKATSSGWILI